MRLVWTLLKVAVALAIVVPLGIIGVSIAIGLLGALVALAFLVLKVAVLGLAAYGAFRLVARMLGWHSPARPTAAAQQLRPVDPYYESALRDLDRELGHQPGR